MWHWHCGSWISLKLTCISFDFIIHNRLINIFVDKQYDVWSSIKTNSSVPYTVLTCPTPQMTILLLYIKEIRWQVMLIAWGLIIIHKLNNHPSRKTEGPLRLNKTVFIHNKHHFRDVNEKIEVNSMFKKRRYGMPAVRLNMEITSHKTQFPQNWQKNIFWAGKNV